MRSRVPLWKLAASAALDWLAPRECAACAEHSPRGLCATCRTALVRPVPRTLDGIPVLAGVSYRAPVDRAIQRFKYDQRPDLARALIDLLPVSVELATADVIVPVPLHPARLAERGFNQAALLGAGVARRLRVAMQPRALRRVVATEQQARLSASEREHNVEAAFIARQPARLAGRRVVLVDDVITTGATARACARALKRAAARPIAFLCVASTEA